MWDSHVYSRYIFIRLGCGTTWHSAGLLGAIRGSHAHSKLTMYSNQLYSQLENESFGTGTDVSICMYVCMYTGPYVSKEWFTLPSLSLIKTSVFTRP